MASNPENVRLTVLMKLQEAIDEEAILEEQILTLMHRFADRFTDRRVEINNLMVLHDHALVDYAKYALGCMTGADMKKCVYLKSVRDELLRSMEEKHAKECKQDKCHLEIPLDFEEDVFDDEVQRNEAIPLSVEEIALDASSEGTLSPGGPRYDYMMSSEAEDE
ncbi:hypothetical protein Tco_1105360 [Tanacetum coccineum]